MDALKTVDFPCANVSEDFESNEKKRSSAAAGPEDRSAAPALYSSALATHGRWYTAFGRLLGFAALTSTLLCRESPLVASLSSLAEPLDQMATQLRVFRLLMLAFDAWSGWRACSR